MMTQTALQLGQEGMTQVWDNSTQAWREKAFQVCKSELAGYVTGEVIRDLVESRIGEAHHYNFYGSLTRKLANAGVIVPTGRYVKGTHPKGHGREVKEYLVR